MVKKYTQGSLYVVEYDDDEWHAGDQDEIRAAAEAECRQTGCATLAVFAMPDFLFPAYGYTTKQRVHHKVFNDEPFRMLAMFTASFDTAEWNAWSPDLKRKRLEQARDALNQKARGVAGRYEISHTDGKNLIVLERGRV